MEFLKVNGFDINYNKLTEDFKNSSSDYYFRFYPFYSYGYGPSDLHFFVSLLLTNF